VQHGPFLGQVKVLAGLDLPWILWTGLGRYGCMGPTACPTPTPWRPLCPLATMALGLGRDL